jgi:hypothetical protein
MLYNGCNDGQSIRDGGPAPGIIVWVAVVEAKAREGNNCFPQRSPSTMTKSKSGSEIFCLWAGKDFGEHAGCHVVSRATD